MATNFFQAIQDLNIKSDLRIAISQENENRFIVSVLLANDKVGDNARNIVAPMIFKGTPQELDEGFFSAFEKPALQTDLLFANMEQHAKSMEEARLQSRIEQDKQKTEKKKEQETGKKENKKYELQIKKVDELEAVSKFGAAIGQLPKVEQFPEFKEEIEKRLASLKEKGGFIL